MPQFLASDFRNLLDAMAADPQADPVSRAVSGRSKLLTELARRQPLKEARMTKEQVINILAGFRQTAKGSEMVNAPPLPDNFANQIANGLWEVISWLQAMPEPQAPAAPATPVAPAPAVPAAPAPAA